MRPRPHACIVGVRGNSLRRFAPSRLTFCPSAIFGDSRIPGKAHGTSYRPRIFFGKKFFRKTGFVSASTRARIKHRYRYLTKAWGMGGPPLRFQRIGLFNQMRITSISRAWIARRLPNRVCREALHNPWRVARPICLAAMAASVQRHTSLNRVGLNSV